MVDYYSRYIEIARLSRTTTAEVVSHLKSIFARHGIPEIFISDNGPQYASREFEEFAKEYQFRHVTSSPYFPQANGEAERAVGTIKGLLKKGGDPYKALLAYRCTPLQQLGYSPSQLLMGRVLRSSVPTTMTQRKPRVPDLTDVRARDKKSKARQKRNHDARHGARDLTPLQPGDSLWIPQCQNRGLVREEVAPHSYTVEIESDTIRRNRRDLIHLSDTDERGAPPELDEHAEPDEEAEPNTMSHSDNQSNDSSTERFARSTDDSNNRIERASEGTQEWSSLPTTQPFRPIVGELNSVRTFYCVCVHVHAP